MIDRLRHLRTDQDVFERRPLRSIVRRTIGECGRDMVAATRVARGSSRIASPYWVARYFLGMASRPMHSQATIALTVDHGGRRHPTVLRKNQSDVYIWREIFLERIYDFDYERFVGDVSLVVDLGANAGLSASYFQMRFPAARIIAVEPLAENVDVIRANARALRAEWEVEEAAVAAESGRAEFYASEWWSSGSLVQRIGEYRQSMPNRVESVLSLPRRSVEVITVGELLEKHGVRRVPVMKMDIEGCEDEVLTSGAEWLRRVGVLIVEVHSKYIDPEVVDDRLRDAGFAEVPHHGPCSVFVNTGYDREMPDRVAAATAHA